MISLNFSESDRVPTSTVTAKVKSWHVAPGVVPNAYSYFRIRGGQGYIVGVPVEVATKLLKEKDAAKLRKVMSSLIVPEMQAARAGMPSPGKMILLMQSGDSIRQVTQAVPGMGKKASIGSFVAPTLAGAAAGAIGTAANNYANKRDIREGVGKAALTGGVVGGALHGALQLKNKFPIPAAPTVQAAPATPPPAPQTAAPKASVATPQVVPAPVAPAAPSSAPPASAPPPSAPPASAPRVSRKMQEQAKLYGNRARYRAEGKPRSRGEQKELQRILGRNWESEAPPAVFKMESALKPAAPVPVAPAVPVAQASTSPAPVATAPSLKRPRTGGAMEEMLENMRASGKMGSARMPLLYKIAAEMTYKARKNLGTGDFALPGRRYPIHDRPHARNALARVAQHGTPSEQKQVRQAVHSRFPDVGDEKKASAKDERDYYHDVHVPLQEARLQEKTHGPLRHMTADEAAKLRAAGFVLTPPPAHIQAAYWKELARRASEKKAGMPFLEQDRPERVKAIFRALKREHPGMPAEMKARIAARQGKPGKQHQGPPYKGPLSDRER